MIRRSAVIEAGLFDPAFRRLQDWEFWLRLLRHGYTFAGSPTCLVHYRLHGSSLSADVKSGQEAAVTLAEKHFGPDDGRWESWGADKRRMYGGVYRYHALTSSLLRAGDWQACAHYLRRALQIDPTLAQDLDLFYELALGTQPLGWRGTFDHFSFEQSATHLQDLLQTLFTRPAPPGLTKIRRTAFGTAYYALGLVAYNAGALSSCRRCLWRAMGYRAELSRNRLFLASLLRSCVGRTLRDMLRPLRATISQA